MKSVLMHKIALACAALAVVAGLSVSAPTPDVTAGPAAGGTNFPTVARARV